MIQLPNLPFSAITIPTQLYFFLIQILIPPRQLLPPPPNPHLSLNLTVRNQTVSRIDIREIERYNQIEITNAKDGCIFLNINDMYIVIVVILLTYLCQTKEKVCEASMTNNPRIRVNQSLTPSHSQAYIALTNPWVNIKVHTVPNVTITNLYIYKPPPMTNVTVGNSSTRTMPCVMLYVTQYPSFMLNVNRVPEWSFTHPQVFGPTCHPHRLLTTLVTEHIADVPRKTDAQNDYQNRNKQYLPDSLNTHRGGLLRNRGGVLDFLCHLLPKISIIWHTAEVPRKIESQNICQDMDGWTIPDSIDMSRDIFLGGRSEETWSSTLNKVNNILPVNVRHLVIPKDLFEGSIEFLFLFPLDTTWCCIVGLHSLPVIILTGFSIHTKSFFEFNVDNGILTVNSRLSHRCESLKERRVAEDKNKVDKVDQLSCNIPGARKTAVIHDQVINRLYSDSSSIPSEGLPIDDSAPTLSVDLSLVKAKRQLEDLPGPQKFCRWIKCKLANGSIAQRYIAHMKEGHQRIVLKVKVQHRKHHRKRQKEERRQKRDNLGYQTVLQGHERMGQNLQLLSQFYNVDKVQFRQQHGWNWTR